jgi:hypothetical protein
VAPIEFRPASRENILKSDPLRTFSVDWLQIVESRLITQLQRCIENAGDERPIQQFLTKHPIFLACTLGGGHGRWVIPQARLGAEHVPDFVLGEGDSDGTHWTLVELESPLARLFTRKGPPARQLSQAMFQIRSWRAWLDANRDYATRPPSEKGLGLKGISSASVRAIIVVGRRRALTEMDLERRRALHGEVPIVVHTYDWLLDSASALMVRRPKRSRK